MRALIVASLIVVLLIFVATVTRRGEERSDQQTAITSTLEAEGHCSLDGCMHGTVANVPNYDTGATEATAGRVLKLPIETVGNKNISGNSLVASIHDTHGTLVGLWPGTLLKLPHYSDGLSKARDLGSSVKVEVLNVGALV